MRYAAEQYISSTSNNPATDEPQIHNNDVTALSSAASHSILSLSANMFATGQLENLAPIEDSFWIEWMITQIRVRTRVRTDLWRTLYG